MLENISLCIDDKCPMKATCKRWYKRYRPSEYQAYADFQRIDDKCDFYIEVENV